MSDPLPLPEGHPVREAWVKRIAEGSTPLRELGPNGEFRGWIDSDKPLRVPSEASAARPSAPLLGAGSGRTARLICESGSPA